MTVTWVNKYLSEQDLKEIEEAVSKAEKSTSGEIVPVLIRESGTYIYVPFVIFAALFMVLVLQKFYVFPIILDGILALVLATLLAKVYWVRRLFSFPADVARQVNERAELEFYRSRIHKTKDSTGVLLFLSFQEHMAVVLADEAVNKYHNSDTWREIVRILTESAKEGSLKEGIIKAIDKCGEILAQKFPKKEFDTDELSNKLVIKEN